MRIAFMHPTYWPEVRRGSERLIHDLAVGLAGRGHELTILTTHPDATTIAEEEGVRVVRSRRPPELRPLRWYEDFIATVPIGVWRLWRGAYDIAHAFFPADGVAAAWTRQRLGGPPFVLSLHGIPNRKYLVERRYRLDQLKQSIALSAETTVLSEAVAEPVRRYLLHDPTILPGGVVTADFAVEAERAPRPTIVCAASLVDPRKRGELLLEGFRRLRERRPDAELILVRVRDPHFSRASLPELGAGARWADADDTSELARLYASSWTSVLPAIDEAFGLVLVEALAAGTPVVAARSGACPEIVDDPSVGRLFEPDDPDDLARALDEALELSEEPGTDAACRSHADRYDIAHVVDQCERIYARALGRSEVATARA